MQFSSVRSLSRVRLFATPWTAALKASLYITNSQSIFKLMSIQSVIPSNHLILCRPLLLLPSIFLSIKVFSKESVVRIREPKYWSFSFSISSSSEYSGLISFRVDWSDLKALVVIIFPAFIPLGVQDAQQGIPRLSTCGIFQHKPWSQDVLHGWSLVYSHSQALK